MTQLCARYIAADPQLTACEAAQRALDRGIHTIFVTLPFSAPVGVTPTLRQAHQRAVRFDHSSIDSAIDALLAIHRAAPTLTLYVESVLNLLAIPGLEASVQKLHEACPFVKGLLINDTPIAMQTLDPVLGGQFDNLALPLVQMTGAALPMDTVGAIVDKANAHPEVVMLVDPTMVAGNLAQTNAIFQGELIATLPVLQALESPVAQALTEAGVAGFMVMDGLYQEL